MLERVELRDIASYRGDAQRFESLGRINLVFGTNGSGKTTLSRVLADPEKYSSCTVVWTGNRPLETLVFNADFVARNFDQAAELHGIFSLGEDNVKVTRALEDARNELSNIEAQAAKYNEALRGPDGAGGKVAELNQVEGRFRDLCWEVKAKFEPAFTEAFRGERNSQDHFRGRVLRESATNRSALRPLDELTVRAATVFDRSARMMALLDVPDFAPLAKLETIPLLAKPIVGRSDVPIAALITRLQNSDWVEQGRKFFDVSEPVCPFCQQSSAPSLRQQLDVFFDESFAQDTAEIERRAADYERVGSSVIAEAERLFGQCPDMWEETDLRDRVNALGSLVSRNSQVFDEKRREPSRSLHCEASTAIATQITALIEAANTRIRAHNALLEGLELERPQLIGEIWKYLLENDFAPYLQQYDEDRGRCLKAIAGLEESLAEARRRQSEATARIRELEASTTSVQPTVDRINGLLHSFGFSGFALETTTDRLKYRLVRPDGSDANTTLSEGEKGFITFLYFISLVRGSQSRTGVVQDKVVVIDDPVSSLDAGVMFVVSSLVRQFFSEVRRGGPIKQVLVLTHNVYFHKELALPSRESDHDVRYWLVQKISGNSRVLTCKANPVRTSYELLWQQVRNPDPTSIQNVLRRILEHYFQILGNVRLSELEDKFSDPMDRAVCHSLVQWVHDGSHNVLDDPYLSPDEAMVSRYLSVFKRIFTVTNHSAHYDMMMGSSPGSS